MTISSFLLEATTNLKAAGIDSARLDCLVLLEDELGLDRARLLAHPEMLLTDRQKSELNKKCMQRKTHLPLAYIRGQAAFFGRTFSVDKSVLVPRPETEMMLSMLLELDDLPAKPLIADVGTGSGCIGIVAALELPEATVYLYDVDSSALRMARKNAALHNVKVTVTQQDLLSDCSIPFTVVLANLPYVPQKHPINTAATHEPPIALFAGEDGFALYRLLWQQLRALPVPPRYVLTESLIPQHRAQTALAEQSGFQLHNTKGLIQLFCPA